MKKTLAIFMVILLTLSLTACLGRSKVERYAKAGWEATGSAGASIDKIFVMHYTSRRCLSGEVLDTPMYSQMPSNGYAVLYYSMGSGFSDCYACFFDQDGKLALSFDYEENEKLFDLYYGSFSIYNTESGEKALEYLKNCNYISAMMNDAYDVAVEDKLEKDVWFSFSEETVEWITE